MPSDGTAAARLAKDLRRVLTCVDRFGQLSVEDRRATDAALAELLRELAVQVAARNIRTSLALSLVASADEVQAQAEGLPARPLRQPCTCSHPVGVHAQNGCTATAEGARCDCRRITGLTQAQDRERLTSRVGLCEHEARAKPEAASPWLNQRLGGT